MRWSEAQKLLEQLNISMDKQIERAKMGNGSETDVAETKRQLRESATCS